MSRRPCTRWQRGRANLSASLSSASSTTPGSGSPSTWTTSMWSRKPEARELEPGWWRYHKTVMNLPYPTSKCVFNLSYYHQAVMCEGLKMKCGRCSWHVRAVLFQQNHIYIIDLEPKGVMSNNKWFCSGPWLEPSKHWVLPKQRYCLKDPWINLWNPRS